VLGEKAETTQTINIVPGRRLSTGSALRSSGNGCTAPGSWKPTVSLPSFRFNEKLAAKFPSGLGRCFRIAEELSGRSQSNGCNHCCEVNPRWTLQTRNFLIRFLTGKGRSSIAIFLAMALAFLGSSGPPHRERRQIGADCGSSQRPQRLSAHHYEYHPDLC